MDMNLYRVEEYLLRVEKLIKSAEGNSLKYACLELRLAIEKIIQKRVMHLGVTIPANIYDGLLPPKLMKLLLGFEASADQTLIFSYQLHTEDGEPIGDAIDVGESRIFKSKWLVKYYNKLGKYLHQPNISELSSPPVITIAELQAIASEIKRVNETDNITSISSFSELSCECCSTKMWVSSSQIENGAEVECFNIECHAIYKVSEIDGESFNSVRKNPNWTMKCMKCGQPNALDSCNDGMKFNCWSCKYRYVISVQNFTVHPQLED